MTAVVPQKRSTSPAGPTTDGHDPLKSPTASKQPRPDASVPSKAAVAQGYRRPKQLRGVTDSGPQQMRDMDVTYLTSQFEVDDSGEYKEALLALEGLIAGSAFPTRQHIRQVLALCFFPLFFKPPTRVSAFARATSTSSTSKSVLPPFDQDPFVLSHKKLRDEARKVLDDVVSTNGVDVVCRSIKGYGMPKPVEPPKNVEDPFAAASLPPPAPSTPAPNDGRRNPKVARGKDKAKESAAAKDANGSDEDLALSDTDDVLAVSAKRIATSENLWDFLAGTSAKKPRVWTRERPVLDGGWEVLRSLVDGWEVEWEKNQRVAHASDIAVPPLSLMRYFKPSATSTVARELSSKAFDVAFWPFSDASLPQSETDSDDSERDSDDDDLFDDDDFDAKGYGTPKKGRQAKRKGTKKDDEVTFEGGMSLEEKRIVGVRLLSLIGDSATVGHFDGMATLGDFVQRMKSLDPSIFPTFLDLLSLHSSSTSPFLSRLLAAYLENHSHPLSANAALDIHSLAKLSNSALASSSSSDLLTSPRKRALAAQSSMVSIPGDSPSQMQSQGVTETSQKSEADVEAEFWKTPPPDSQEFLALASRIPIEVQLPVNSVAATAAASGGGGGRKVKSTMASSFDRAQRAAESHRLVKEALIACKYDDGSEDREKRDRSVGRIRALLEGVDEAVEQARQRSQKK